MLLEEVPLKHTAVQFQVSLLGLEYSSDPCGWIQTKLFSTLPSIQAAQALAWTVALKGQKSQYTYIDADS